MQTPARTLVPLIVLTLLGFPLLHQQGSETKVTTKGPRVSTRKRKTLRLRSRWVTRERWNQAVFIQGTYKVGRLQAGSKERARLKGKGVCKSIETAGHAFEAMYRKTLGDRRREG